MRDHTWLQAFDHALQAIGVGAADRAEALVETEGFLIEAQCSAYEHFGPPNRYAAAVAQALEAGASPRTGPVGRVVVEATALVKSYRRVRVLDKLDLRVHSGEVVALTGPNGAGKSTLLRLIAGLDSVDAGSVDLRGRVGYVPQTGGLDPWLTPDEHCVLFGTAAHLGRREARAEGRRLARELGWDSAGAPVVGELSGGTAQKLGIICALLGQPDLLLLDEPYQGMDAESRQRFWALLWAWQESGGAAVVASHDPDVLTGASVVVELDRAAAS